MSLVIKDGCGPFMNETLSGKTDRRHTYRRFAELNTPAHLRQKAHGDWTQVVHSIMCDA